MIDAMGTIIACLAQRENAKFDDIKDWLELLYYVSQIIVMFMVIVGVPIALNSLRIARKNLLLIERTNAENNAIQQKLVLQSRLTELSHEWNSRSFIEARNKASYIFEREFTGKHEEVRRALSNKKRINDWIFVSMVAHFFYVLAIFRIATKLTSIMHPQSLPKLLIIGRIFSLLPMAMIRKRNACGIS